LPASRRSIYIQESIKALPMLGSEWHYRADDGKVLVRVTGKVRPSLAKQIEANTRLMARAPGAPRAATVSLPLVGARCG